ncbi:MAG TPA: hypothetical protein PKC43_00455 [Phycisphaerales bacterium]|nr:hypothetical protein [Phycisphaerales bacterium]HMP35896.1 hypothetical protein [Phycisphaerales bacterium]
MRRTRSTHLLVALATTGIGGGLAATDASLAAGSSVARAAAPAASPVEVVAGSVLAAPPPSPERITIEGAIRRSDDGLPLGNGRLGVLLWGEGRTIRLSLDRSDLWDLRRPEVVTGPDWTWATMRRLKEEGRHDEHIRLFDAPYDTVPYPTKLPGGRVEIDLPPGTTIVDFSLDLSDGEATIWLADGKGYLPLRVEVHPDEPLVRLTGAFEPAAVRIVRPTGLDRLGFDAAASGADGELRWLAQATPEGPAYAVAALRSILGPTGKQPRRATVAAALVDDPDRAAARRRAIETVRDGAELARSRAGRFAPAARAWVRLPDARIQAQYDLCAYLYRAAAGPGAPPMPLQGLWTVDDGGLPPWKGDYHNNLNTQMTYAAYLVADLIDEGATWIEFNWSLLDRYRRFAHEFYGLPDGCAVIPGVMALNGAPLGGWGQHSLSPTNGAWIAWQFWRHWRFTADPEFLRNRAAPFCDEIGRGLLALLEPVETAPSGDRPGRVVLRLPLSSSPEIHDNSPRAWLAPNSNYDLAAMTALFQANRAMAEELGRTEDVRLWSDALERLEPLDVAEGALTFARGEPCAMSHRHLSHAMAIHPFGLLATDGGDEEEAIIAATLDRIAAQGTRAWVGYSFSWFAAMCARADRAEQSLDHLEKYLSFIGINGFHLNGDQSGNGLSDFTYRPFTLEGNFLAMEAVHEMLLRSRAGAISVFPAVSRRWPDVEFGGLRAEGGFLISARRRGGRTTECAAMATRDGELRLRNPFIATLAEGERLVALRIPAPSSGAAGDAGAVGAIALDPDAQEWRIRLGAGERVLIVVR